MKDFAFKLYLLFTVSWFLHFPARFPILGVIRFDLILIFLIFLFIILGKKNNQRQRNLDETSKILMILILYIISTLPFVEWPGSVLKKNSLNFIKVIIFYYYTVSLVATEKKLKAFMAIFLFCQSFRVFEPLYLHITEGYWGDKASMMAGEEFMNRLAGSPSDVINPNGLAFIIVSIIPFFYYFSSISWINKIIYFLSFPAFIYALILTASRSGIVALIAILAGIVIKSKRKVILAGIIFISSFAVFANLTPDQRDRFTSLYDENTKNYRTSQGRTQGVIEDIKIALKNPLVGHGLGTSPEARFHSIGSSLLSHNLYTEIMLELGLIGLIIFLLFMKLIIVNFSSALKKIKENPIDNAYLLNITHAMQVWFIMNLLFSFASYGLSTYVWYLFGGLSVVIKKLADEKTTLKQV